MQLSSCLAAGSAAPVAAPAASASSHGEAAVALFERGQALVEEGDSVRAEQYLATALREGYDWQAALPLCPGTPSAAPAAGADAPVETAAPKATP